MKQQKMIRVDNDIYFKLIQKRSELIADYKANYTMSEVIEILLLEAKCYEHK